MHKIAKYAIVVNIIIALIFVYSNVALWSLVNAEYPYLVYSHWSPLGISAPHYIINNEGSIAQLQTVYSYFNSPFWIFWVLLMVNLYFIVKISKESKKQSQTNSEISEN
jgi:hypothetical protein